jgi:hypothetical protein
VGLLQTLETPPLTALISVLLGVPKPFPPLLILPVAMVKGCWTPAWEDMAPWKRRKAGSACGPESSEGHEDGPEAWAAPNLVG